MLNFDQIITTIDPERDYTVKEVAGFLERSESAVRAHVMRKTFPAKKIFSTFYIKGIDIRNYLEKRV